MKLISMPQNVIWQTHAPYLSYNDAGDCIYLVEDAFTLTRQRLFSYLHVRARSRDEFGDKYRQMEVVI